MTQTLVAVLMWALVASLLIVRRKRADRSITYAAIAIAIATFLVPGIQPFGFAETWVCFAFVGLFLNIVDSFVKPFLTVISLPLTIITLGIFQLVVNSFMLELASYLSVNLLGAGISIASFGSAFMGSILVSIMRSILDGVAEG